MKFEKYYIFDFDGVVCDSTHECMINSYNSYNKYLNKKFIYKTHLSQFSKKDINIFKKVRPLAKGAFDYFIIYSLLNKFNYTKINSELINQYTTNYINHKKNFVKIFYNEREKLKKQSLKNWIDLHIIYNDVIQILKQLNNQNKLLIATLKDSKSVLKILKNYKININKKNILSENEIKSKLDALNKFKKQLRLNKNQFIFFDDNIYHLIKPKNEGYNVYLASWGNYYKPYRKLASSYSIKVVNDINKFKFI